MLGAIVGKTIPEPAVPAEYVLAKTPLLVIAESKSSDTLTQIDGDRLGRLVTNELDKFQVAPTINPDELVALRDRLLTGFDGQSVQSIGRDLGADHVLYVEIQSVGVGTAPGSDVARSVASAQVRLIDVQSGRVVYPESATGGRLVSFQTRPARITSEMSPSGLRGQALDGLAHNIVKLFRSWRAEDEPSEVGMDQ